MSEPAGHFWFLAVMKMLLQRPGSCEGRFRERRMDLRPVCCGSPATFSLNFSGVRPEVCGPVGWPWRSPRGVGCSIAPPFLPGPLTSLCRPLSQPHEGSCSPAFYTVAHSALSKIPGRWSNTSDPPCSQLQEMAPIF